MGWLTAITELVDALAWPVALVVVVVVLKHEVKDVIQRLSHLKYGEFEARFDAQIAKTEAWYYGVNKRKISKSGTKDVQKLIQTELLSPSRYEVELFDELDKWLTGDPSFIDVTKRLMETFHPAAIMNLWVHVEQKLHELAVDNEIEAPDIGGYIKVARELSSRNVLSKKALRLLEDLYDMRNMVQHSPGRHISKSLVRRYAYLVIEAMKEIDRSLRG